MELRELLHAKRVFCDGGSGSYLQAHGLKAGVLPETWNLSHPEIVQNMAAEYYAAGANIVNSNTFGANRLKYQDDLEAIVTAGVRHVCRARDLSGRNDVFAALDIGPTGKLLEPMGDLSFDAATELFGEVVRIGARAGADLVLIETMSDTYEIKAAVLAAKENCDLPVCATVTFDASGKLLTGGTVDVVVAMLEGLGVDALGMNCGLGPEQMMPLAAQMLEAASVPVIVNPNAGLPRSEGGLTVYDVGPGEFALQMQKLAGMGVQILGGCCGTTPDHIRALTEACRDIPYTAPVKKDRTVITSFSNAVRIGTQPVIIGERINPTGKKKFQQALRDQDMGYILAQGIEQEDSGAMVLDVNVGLPDIDEPAMMLRVMRELQAITSLPLQIDTSDAEALEKALRYYNGKPLVNSVNGKKESLETVLPLVRKYGGVVVGLTLDEQGIPDSAAGRVAVARKIYEAAESFGIDRKDVLIDCLAMAVSSDSKGALTTLAAIRHITEQMNGKTILGVSNISFGLPRREIINAAFLTMALQMGLSCAIMNPNNEDMMRAMRAFCALSDLDPQFGGYISAYAGTQPDAVSAAAAKPKEGAASENREMGLAECVERGLSARAGDAVRAELARRDPLEIVDQELIPALDKVGRGFEKGTLFLPQLLMSAEAAQAAFSVIRESMQGQAGESKGQIILATVKNDIHDIGKNIVKVMLENYGYDVIDLGKDVDPETIVECAIEHNIRLVGLSALMTTTVVSMEETIRLLRERKPDTKIVVGGAVMTQEYADKIGADAYARDAMETVRYADRVFAEA